MSPVPGKQAGGRAGRRLEWLDNNPGIEPVEFDRETWQPLGLVYQAPLPAGSRILFEDFRTVLNSNPCEADTDVDILMMKDKVDKAKDKNDNN